MKYAIFLVAALASHLAVAETVEREAAAAPRGDVEIVNVSGSVHVIGWDRPQVQLRAELDAGPEILDFKAQDDKVLIRVKQERGEGSNSLVVRVPRASSVIIKTVSASQRLENIDGDQRLQSVSGDIETQVGAGDFEAKSVSGAIRAVGKAELGSVRASSVSGGIELQNVAGDLEITTVNGPMNIRAQSIDRARLKTTNGEVRFHAALLPDGRADLEAINGSINTVLNGKVNATFDIETFNGDIDNCFGPEPQNASQYAPGRNLRFTEGDGKARVRIKTLNGAVSLCRDK